MTTINISLPNKLKTKADELIASGHYASFSDLARTGLRQLILDHKLQQMSEEAKKEYREGKSIVIKSKKDLEKYFSQFK